MDYHTNNHPKSFFQRWVPSFIRNDFFRKILALCFAILVYHMVSTKIGVEEKIANVPVELELPANLVNLNSKPMTVTVLARGSSKNLAGISPADIKIKAIVVENKFLPGTPYLLRLTADNVKPPYGITVRDIIPKDLMLSLEKNVIKKVPVEAKFDSLRNLPKDFIIGKVKFNPSQVWISGPQSIVRNVEIVMTQPVPLDNQTVDSFEFQALVAVPEAITVSPPKVMVQVEIVRDVTTQTFKSVPIRLLEYPDSKEKFRVEFQSTPNADITLSGPKSKITLLKPETIRPYIDISPIEESGAFSAEVYCWLQDPEIKVQSIYPEKVQITLSKIKTTEIKN